MPLRISRVFSRSLFALALCAGGVIAVSAPAASAQQIAVTSDVGFGGMGGLTAPIGKSDIEQMAKLLDFNKDQVAAANVLLETYLSEHAKRAGVMKTEQEKARTAMREDRDFTAMTELGAKSDAFEKESAAKEQQLLENIKGLLESKQTEQWPVWERAHRRAGSMNRGMLIGERTDLIQLVERLNLPAPAQKAVAPTLDAYAIALDRVIVARDEAQKTLTEEGKKMRDDFQKNGGFGGGNMMEMMKKGDEMMKKGREASTPVRDVNRSFAKQIEGTLSGVDAALGEKFADAVRRATFPDIYRERYVDKALASAAAMEDLDKSQQEGVAALKTQFALDRRAVESSLEKAAEDDEANFSLAGMMSGGMGRMMGGSEATQAARKARRELETSVLDKLKALLGEERAAKLPDRSAETPESPFGGMGGLRVRTQ